MIENSVVCESDEVNNKVVSKVCLGTDGIYQGNYFAPATTTTLAYPLPPSPNPYSIEFSKYLISPQKYQCAMPGCSTFSFTQGAFSIVPYCTACSQANTTYTMNF